MPRTVGAALIALGVVVASRWATLDALGAVGRMNWSQPSIDTIHMLPALADLT